MSWFIKGCLAFATISALQGCGKGPNVDPTITTILPSPPGPIEVQLNAQQTYVMGTESAQLSDSRSFTVPSKIKVVGGTFNCGYVGCNSSVMRAKIIINDGAIECRYESTNVHSTYMSLLDCGGFTTHLSLQKDDTITLVPQYAPGLLLEVSFTLTK